MKIISIILVLITVLKAGVAVRGVAIESDDTLTLKLYADTSEGDQLRSYGLLVDFDTSFIKVRSVERFDSLWFLSADGGANRESYLKPKSVGESSLEILGLRMDGITPDRGLVGESLLLATVIFDVEKAGDPGIVLTLPRPEPFVNFGLADGTSVDDSVTGLKEGGVVVFQDPSKDEDSDGLPDDYEVTIFGKANVSDGSGDFDGDGYSDLHEWRAGTDPTDPDSLLKLEFVMMADGRKVLSWDGFSGRVYRLEKSNDLSSGSFFPVVGALPGLADMMIEAEADGASRAFYRLGVELPE